MSIPAKTNISDTAMPPSASSQSLSIRLTTHSSISMSQNDNTTNQSRVMRTSSLPVSTQSHIPIPKNVAHSGRSVPRDIGEKEEEAPKEDTQQGSESTTLSLNEAIILSDHLDRANRTIEGLYSRLKERDTEKTELEKRLEDSENDAQRASERATAKLYEAAEQLDRAKGRIQELYRKLEERNRVIRERDGEIRELRNRMREADEECVEILKVCEREREDRLQEEKEEEEERLRMGEPAIGELRRKLQDADEDVERLRVCEAINKKNKTCGNFVGSL
jgi:chromosome segregation ATPase